jgi:ATP-dependent helicase/nuclease subunit A
MNDLVPHGVIADQHAASDPAASAWVSANAGAGKTHVLAQRVIRLLLNGTTPEKILCLTYTKAAAANMANRIFATLGEWIGFDDAKLDAAIKSTGAKAADIRQRERARRLFACALDTPGGLKVQTIHGFCARLLQQFPFEANVAARFRVMEETEQRKMLEDIRRQVLLEAANAHESTVGRALATVIPMASDFAIQDALSEALRERSRIASWFAAAGGLDGARAQLSDLLGIKPEDSLADVEAEIEDGPNMPSSEWAAVAGICAGSTRNDQDRAGRLKEACETTGPTRIDAYLSVFFTGDGALRKSVITNALAKQYPDLKARLDRERDRIGTLCERRRALTVRDRTMALLAIANEMIRRYAAEKDRRGLLDYEDMIARTRDLLKRVEATWVHYKLDLGVDHVLIDEAQDTSPEQWDIIKRFVAEFSAGAGARGMLKRSIFAVGDDKQSIFSFQGAEPTAFDEHHRYFRTALGNPEQEFRSIPFKYSFRSVPAVLDAVDAVFRQPTAHAGLSADPVATVHLAVRDGAPGLVELWPLFVPEKKEKVPEWDAPFDTTSETSSRVRLARQIAAAVKVWLARGDPVGDGDKRHPLRAGDILILVRQRGPLFEAIIRQLKNKDIPVAGADRLMLTEHIAVMDLLAVADALLLPHDDLALASVLKSPLFGFSEEDLYALAFNRGASLRTALSERRPGVAARLDAMGQAALRQTPFGFYAELLGAGRGRQAFLARLGPEANDALDEFLNLALAYEIRETPSLQGFVAWLRTASAEVKRDLEIARDEVRVMTVHGAKGLEAPVVVLADTTTLPAGPPLLQPRLHRLASPSATPDAPECIAWMPNKRDETGPLPDARLAIIAATENEYRRLLYVAMTRAADRLVVCGATGENGAPAGCWYELVQQGLEATGRLVEEQADAGDGMVLRFRRPADAVAAEPGTADATLPPESKLPPWLACSVAAEPPRSMALRPSALEGEPRAGIPARSSADRKHALARGNAVHRLMQSLTDTPPDRRAEAARRFLARRAELSEAERDEIAREVLAVLADPRFAPLFAPGSKAEVSIAGRIGELPISGQVDRLVVTDEAVLIADYKSNRPPPRSLAQAQDRHGDYVVQLAVYRAVLKQLYPDRPVRAALVWTATPELMELPEKVLDLALDKTIMSA